MLEWGSAKSMLHFGMADTKRYCVKEWAMQVVYSVIQKNKDSNLLDASTKADIDMRQKSL